MKPSTAPPPRTQPPSSTADSHSSASAPATTQDQLEFFEKKIRPVLADRCFKCHSHQSEKLKGSLYLDSLTGLLKGGDTGPAVEPGQPEKSLLIEAVRCKNTDLEKRRAAHWCSQPVHKSEPPAVPELMDLSGETAPMKKMYGLDAPWKGTQTCGHQCLLARRLVERGVRFIEITCPGGGVKGGVSHGETDEWGYKAIDGKAEIHDLHATMLYLLGVEHTRSTFRFSARDMRLTDVHGHVIHDIIA